MFDALNELTPIQALSLNDSPKISLSIKRDELNHNAVQGNKWRKLKFNLLQYEEKKYDGIISFGGVFSNHIFALASACSILKIPCILFLRAHQLDVQNPTIKHLIKTGCKLELLDYETYRNKNKEPFLNKINEAYPNHMIIPEGGSNALGIKGAEELGRQILSQISPPDYLCVAAGTGGTAAGLIKAFAKERTKILVFSSLKGDFLHGEIANWTGNLAFELITDYHFGGYAKFNQELISFINEFKINSNIQLEPIYTGKMMFAVYDLIRKGYFESGSEVLCIHTGGLQGILGYNFLNAKKYGKIKI